MFPDPAKVSKMRKESLPERYIYNQKARMTVYRHPRYRKPYMHTRLLRGIRATKYAHRYLL